MLVSDQLPKLINLEYVQNLDGWLPGNNMYCWHRWVSDSVLVSKDLVQPVWN